MRVLILAVFASMLGGCDSEALTGPPTSPPAVAVAPHASGSQGGIIVCRRGLTPTEPLYLVNGRIVSPEEALRMDDAMIDSVEVVKGTAAAGLHGSRAALGVVIIFARSEGPSRAR